MALVRNMLDHSVPLTVGEIGPGEELNIDASLPYEAALLADGTLIVVDPSTPPPAPETMKVGVRATVPFATPANPVEVDLSDSAGLATLDNTGKLKAAQAPVIDLAHLGFDPETESEAGVAHAALQAQITTEATARAAADTTEATARAAADALLIPLTQKAAANGVATLDGTGKLPAGQLSPSVASASQLSAVQSDISLRTTLDPDGLTPIVTVTSSWGINAAGDPYYDPNGAASGEEAVLTLDASGVPTLTTLGG